MPRGLKIRLAIYFAALFVCFTLCLSSLRPAVYEARASVKVLKQMSVAGLLSEWIVYDPSDAMASQTAMITGFPVLREVALRRGDIDETASREETDKVVRRYRRRITARRVAKTNMIEITAWDTSARDAVDLVNLVADVYVGENLREKRRQFQTAQRFIERQLAEIENELAAKERVAADKRPAAPFQQKIVELELQKSQLMARYTPRHPQIRVIEEEIGNLERRLQDLNREETLYTQIEREVETDRKIYALLKSKLEEAKISEAQKVPDVSVVNPAVYPESSAAGESIRTILARW